MENAIVVKNLCKSYEGFALDDISFTLPSGCIMGFIGENGAGKTTTIKLLLDLIGRDAGEIEVLGADPREGNRRIKEHIGVVMDECSFPDTLNIKDISRIMKSSFRTWDEGVFSGYCKRFDLPEKKQVKDYSKGMKMKLSIAVALSHDSRLLILDEATSGLDPIVRDEILDVFLEFIQDEGRSVFISSHIISDLEKVCDYITFIHGGKLIMSEEKDVMLERYAVVKCSPEEYADLDGDAVIGERRSSFGIEALVDRERIPGGMVTDAASLEDIMLYYSKGAKR